LGEFYLFDATGSHWVPIGSDSATLVGHTQFTHVEVEIVEFHALVAGLGRGRLLALVDHDEIALS